MPCATRWHSRGTFVGAAANAQLGGGGMNDLREIPAGYGTAVFLDKGDRIRVINTYGNQVLDTWAFNREDMSEAMSMEHTRSVNSRIYPRVGDMLVSTRRRAMLCLVEDTSPECHDTLLCACNRALYEELGCTNDHRSCEDNLHEALAAVFLSYPTTPGPLNLFMNTPVDSAGSIHRQAPLSQPGDAVELLCMMNLVLVFSACPQDITTINGLARTPRDVHYRILQAETAP